MLPKPYAWAYYSINERRCGTVFAIDGKENWLIHNHLNVSENSFDAVDRDWSIRQILGVGPDFKYTILSKEDWVGRRLVADRFREGNVFIAGDAAHLWVPYAGYGMNAGIADGLNLSWFLSAYLNGWADKKIIDAYEKERLPITDQVSRFAMEHAAKMIKARSVVPAGLESTSDAALALQKNLGEEYYRTNVQQFCCEGLNYGYYYDNSPVIVYDDEIAPEYSMGSYVESTVPGCRMPHFYHKLGKSIYDELGDGYTLISINGDEIAINEFMHSANIRNIPFKSICVDDAKDIQKNIFKHKYLICRPDQHIVWRGDMLPIKPNLLLDIISGRGD